MLENTQLMLHGTSPVAKAVLRCSVMKCMTRNLEAPGVSLGRTHQITSLFAVEPREYVSCCHDMTAMILKRVKKHQSTNQSVSKNVIMCIQTTNKARWRFYSYVHTILFSKVSKHLYNINLKLSWIS